MSARPRALNRRAGTPSSVRPPCPGEPPETSACLVGPSPAVGRPAFGERTGSARRPSAGRDFATVLCNHGPSGTRGELVGEPPETSACLVGPSPAVGRPASGEGTGSARRPSAGRDFATVLCNHGQSGTRGERVGEPPETSACLAGPSMEVGRPAFGERTGSARRPSAGRDFATVLCNHGPSGTRGERVGEPPETSACLVGPSPAVGRPASGEGTGSAQRPSAGHGLGTGASSPGPRGTRAKRAGESPESAVGGRGPAAVGRSLSERRAEIGNPHGGQSWATPGCTHVRLCAPRWAPEPSQDPGPGSSEEALCAGAGRTGASRPQAPRARRPGRTAKEAAPA